MKRALCLVSLVSLVACGGNSASPSAPAIAQVGGVWVGTATQTNASGSECAALFQSSNGASDRYTVQITQTGSNLTATSASQTSGISCDYTGTAGTTSVALTGTGCTSIGYQVTCNGLARDAFRVSYSATATVTGNTMSGGTGATYNIFPRGNTTNSLGVVVISNSFTFTR